MKRAHERVLFVIVPLLSLSICLVFAEMAWRLYDGVDPPIGRWDPQLIYTEQQRSEWVHRTAEFSAHVRTNSVGFRSPEFPTAPNPHQKRILFLGDSMVAAKQVEEEERFADLVGAAMGENVETIAMGMDGTNPLHALQHFRILGASMQPDIVIHAIYPLNDIIFDDPRDLFETEDDFVTEIHNSQPTEERRKKSLLDHFTFLKTLYGYVHRRVENATVNDTTKTLGLFRWHTREGLQYLDASDAWERTRTVLRTLKREVEAAGGRYVVVIIPTALEVQTQWQEKFFAQYSTVPREEWDLEGLHERWEQELAKENIPVILVKPAFLMHAQNGEILYYMRDPHINQRGHVLVAEEIVEALKNISL